MTRRFLPILLIALAGGPVACHRKTPTQPCSDPDCAPVETLSATCPPDVTTTTSSPAVTSATVTYGAPTVAGGTPPVTSSCTPASGSSFASGTTTVTCTAKDAIARAATCSFKVTVNVPIAMLQGTMFWAFGDSITAGDNGCDNPCVLSIDEATSYPTVLRGLLTARYTQQSPSVQNFGRKAETAIEGTGRLDALLALSVPDALLLLEGANDFNGDETPGDILDALRSDIDEAKAHGVKKIFLATLTPEIAGGRRAYGIPPLASTDLLGATNALIRSLASNEGVVLVDLFAALNTDPIHYVADPNTQADDGESGDGLHLTVAGRAAVAQAFFSSIQANFEVTPSGQRLLPRPVISARRPGIGR